MKKVFGLLIIFLSIFICNKVYAYKSYKIGDVVTYNGIDFYVIKDSSEDEDYVTLLKAEPLTVDEVNTYGGVGTANNHVNVFITVSFASDIKRGIANDINGYGGVAYYTSETCGLNSSEHWVDSGCENITYENSEVKYVVDAWAVAKITEGLKEVRLITEAELRNNLNFKDVEICNDVSYCYTNIKSSDETPYWAFNEKYSYLMMDVYKPFDWSDKSFTGSIDQDSYMVKNIVYDSYYRVVRPVVEIYKNAIENSIDNNDNEIDNKETEKEVINNNKNESNTKVNVPNTLKSISGLIILIGLVLICVGLNLFIIVKNRSNK